MLYVDPLYYTNIKEIIGFNKGGKWNFLTIDLCDSQKFKIDRKEFLVSLLKNENIPDESVNVIKERIYSYEYGKGCREYTPICNEEKMLIDNVYTLFKIIKGEIKGSPAKFMLPRFVEMLLEVGKKEGFKTVNDIDSFMISKEIPEGYRNIYLVYDVAKSLEKKDVKIYIEKNLMGVESLEDRSCCFSRNEEFAILYPSVENFYFGNPTTDIFKCMSDRISRDEFECIKKKITFKH